MQFDVLTIFPGMFNGVLDASLLGKARQRGLITVRLHDLRDWATDRQRTTDDYGYGGGPGMVMKPEPVVSAVKALHGDDGWVVLLTPQGVRFTQAGARRLAERSHVLLICGRYEGVDERVRELVVDEELSVGDYILGGGEIAALTVIDATARLVPGVVGSAASLGEESYVDGLLEYPHYTRPEEFRGLHVPEVLLSGHHENIRRWRRAQALRRTLDRRPDLLRAAELSDDDRALLQEFELLESEGRAL